jgi:hypothetical protein
MFYDEVLDDEEFDTKMIEDIFNKKKSRKKRELT